MICAGEQGGQAKVVPVQKRENHVNCSDHSGVKCARAAISETYDLLTETHSPENQNREIDAKDHLYRLYERLKKLEAKVKKVEEAHTEKAYGDLWKLIKDITGRKSTQSGQVQGATEAKRVSTWFEQFSKLIGSAPEVEGADNEIPSVFQDLNIEDGPFSMAE